MEEQGEDERPEKEDDVDNTKHPRCFQHGAVLVEMNRPRGATVPAIISKRPKVDVDRAA
jgi:hypothetical protein